MKSPAADFVGCLVTKSAQKIFAKVGQFHYCKKGRTRVLRKRSAEDESRE